MGVVASLLFFGSVVFHELAHARLALHFGSRVKRIVLFIFGGMAQMGRDAPTPWAEFWIAVAGPISSLLLAGIFYLVGRAAGPGLDRVRAPALELAGVNLLLGSFNLIPGFPLDGGRVLRAIVWRLTRNFRRATRIATWVGQGVAYAMIVLGAVTILRGGGLLSGVWLGFIGWFLLNAATAAYAQVAVHEALRGVPVTRIMSREFQLIPPDISVQQFVDEYLSQAPRRSFLVAENGHVAGVVTLEDLRRVPKEERDRVALRQAMTPREALAVVDADDDVERAFRLMNEKEVGQVPVVHDGDVVGLVTRHALLRFLELRAALEA